MTVCFWGYSCKRLFYHPNVVDKKEICTLCYKKVITLGRLCFLLCRFAPAGDLIVVAGGPLYLSGDLIAVEGVPLYLSLITPVK